MVSKLKETPKPHHKWGQTCTDDVQKLAEDLPPLLSNNSLDSEPCAPQLLFDALSLRVNEIDKIRRGLQVNGHSIYSTFAGQPKRLISEKAMRAAVKCASFVMNLAGVPYWLSFGSLLFQTRGDENIRDIDIDMSYDVAHVDAICNIFKEFPKNKSIWKACGWTKIKQINLNTQPAICHIPRDKREFVLNNKNKQLFYFALPKHPTDFFGYQIHTYKKGANETLEKWAIKPRVIVNIDNNGKRKGASHDQIFPADWVVPKPCVFHNVNTSCPQEPGKVLEISYGVNWTSPIDWHKKFKKQKEKN
eukprot:m.235323 g.235323  ORF g.235323 m.235323 type:complete len:304 (-) comp16043_c1_seq1:59-970(-)